MGYHRAVLRAILFDFNGVLVDDEPIHFELFRKVLAEEGIELAREVYYAQYLGFDDRDCLRAAFKAAGKALPAERLAELIERKSVYYQELVGEQGFPAFPGGRELIAEAAAAGLALGAVSGALRGEVAGGLEQLGVRSCFKVLVAAEDVAHSKPDPEGYRKGLEGLNALPPVPSPPLRPREVVAIEDSPAGLEAAAACGLATLGVAQTYREAELTAAEKVVDSIAGLDLELLQSLFAT